MLYVEPAAVRARGPSYWCTLFPFRIAGMSTAANPTMVYERALRLFNNGWVFPRRNPRARLLIEGFAGSYGAGDFVTMSVFGRSENLMSRPPSAHKFQGYWSTVFVSSLDFCRSDVCPVFIAHPASFLQVYAVCSECIGRSRLSVTRI